MSLEEVPMKAGGGAKRNASLEQGVQVSTATQRAATTTRHRHTEKLSGDTYQPLYSLHTEPEPAVRAAVKTVLSCQSFTYSPQKVHFGWA